MTENINNEGKTPEWWNSPFSSGSKNDRFKEVTSFPDQTDIPSVFARSNFQDDEGRKGAVRLAYKNEKFGDEKHQKMLLFFCASTVGINARGRLDGVFAETGLLAPDMLRATSGMDRHKGKNGEKEQVIRNSDFRDQTPPPGSLSTG